MNRCCVYTKDQFKTVALSRKLLTVSEDKVNCGQDDYENVHNI